MKPWKYRGHLLVVAGVVLVGVIAVVWVGSFSAEKTILAGDIEINHSQGPGGNFRPDPMINGSFRLVGAYLYPCKFLPSWLLWLTNNCPPTIKSQGTGGACLVANLNQVNAKRGKSPIASCTEDSECKTGTIDDEYAYCDGSPGKPGECWVKPLVSEDHLCNRSKDYDPPALRIWSLNQDYNTFKDGHGPYAVPPEYRDVQWRVVARLNGATPAEFILVFGPRVWVPSPP